MEYLTRDHRSQPDYRKQDQRSGQFTISRLGRKRRGSVPGLVSGTMSIHAWYERRSELLRIPVRHSLETFILANADAAGTGHDRDFRSQ